MLWSIDSWFAGSIEEASDGDAEVAQKLVKRELLVGAKHPRGVVGVEDESRLWLRIEDHHVRNAGCELLGGLADDHRPAVRRGPDLEDQLRDLGAIAGRQWPLGDPGVTVEGHVGAANRVRAAFGDDSRIVAQHVAEVVLIGIVSQDAGDLATNLSMTTVGWLYRHDPSTNQFLGIALVGASAEFLGGHKELRKSRHEFGFPLVSVRVTRFRRMLTILSENHEPPIAFRLHRLERTRRCDRPMEGELSSSGTRQPTSGF